MSRWQENITYGLDAAKPGGGPTGDVTNALYIATDTNKIYAWDGAAWQEILAAAGGGLTDVVDDATPQLGGNLDVNGNSIVSAATGDIAITPDTTGDVILDGLKWPQADGTPGQFLKTDGAAQLSWDTIPGGGDALTTSSLDQFADVTQTAGKTLAITDNTTLGGGSHSGTNTGDQATIAAVTVANEATDATCFPLFVTAATGDLGPKSNAGLTFNSSTAILAATGFSGPLTGNVTGDVSGSSGSCTGNAATATSATTAGSATTATTAATATNVTAANEATDTTCFPVFVTAATGDLGPKTNAGLTFNSSTGVLGATGFSGPLTGNVTGDCSGSSGSCTGNAATATSATSATSATTATTATNVTAADEAADTTCFPLFATAATGGVGPKTNSGLTFNASTGVLAATGFSGPLTGNVTGNASGSSGSCTGNAATVTTNANLTGCVTSSGNATSSTITSPVFATSACLPQGAGGTTVDAVGEICVDSTSRTLNFHDGTAEVVLNPLRSKSILIMAPVETDDIPIHRFDVATTLVKTVYAIAGSTNWVGQIQEANDAQGTSAADTQAADSTVTGTTTVTSFSNDSFDAGDYAYLKTTSVSGTPTWLHISFYYRENP